MRKCSSCGFRNFQKKDIISFGATRLRYKCPNCNTVSKTDIPSLIIMLVGLAFLLMSVIFLHLDKEVSIYLNVKRMSLFTIGLAIVFIGIRSIRLVLDRGTAL